LEEQSAKYDSLSCELEETRDLLEQSVQSLSSLRVEVDVLQETVSEKQKRVDLLQHDLQGLEEESVTLQNEISRLAALKEEQRVAFEGELSELEEVNSSLQLGGVGVSELESEICRLRSEISSIREECSTRVKSMSDLAEQERQDYEMELDQLRERSSHSIDSQSELLPQIRETSLLLGEIVQLFSPSLLESEPMDFHISPESDTETHFSFLHRSLLMLRLSLARDEHKQTVHTLQEQHQEMVETIEYQQKKIESLKTNKKNLLQEMKELQETIEALQESGDSSNSTSAVSHRSIHKENEMTERSEEEHALKTEIEILKRQITEINQTNEKYVGDLEQMIENLQSENFDLKSYPSHPIVGTNGHSNGVSTYQPSPSPSSSPSLPSNGLSPDLEDLIDNMTMKIKKLETQLNASKKQESSQILLSQQLENERKQLTVRCGELEIGMRALVETSERQENRISELLDEIDRLEGIVESASSGKSQNQQPLAGDIRQRLEEQIDRLQGDLTSLSLP
jgi:chromosome segregation ATPase